MNKKTASLKNRSMVVILLFLGVISGCFTNQVAVNQPAAETNLRAPAYPLITIDPYTSGWSFNDHLYDGPIRHWTGHEQQLIGVIKVDGKNYRFMGEEKVPMQMIVPTFEKEHWLAKYTTNAPEGDWTGENYNASAWKTGKGSFGSPGRLKAVTSWTTPDIWLRREVELEADMLSRDLFIEYSHDDGVEIYINGHQVVNSGNSARANVMQQIPAEAKKYLKPGKNLIAAHCHDGGGESFLDFGIWMRKDNEQQFGQTARQTGVHVLPTRTYYSFEAGSIQLDVIFTAPLLMDDLDLLSRPVNYITYQARSLDGKDHDVSVYIEGSPQWTQDVIHQPVESGLVYNKDIYLLRSETKSQNILGKSGDNVRIDWGYVYFAAPRGKGMTAAIGNAKNIRTQFITSGTLDNSFKQNPDGDLTKGMEALSFADDLGKVGRKHSTGYVMLAYDDVYSIQYFGENLRPYWNRSGNLTIQDQIKSAVKDYAAIIRKCNKFDEQLMHDAGAAGGEKYAELCALAYRQAVCIGTGSAFYFFVAAFYPFKIQHAFFNFKRELKHFSYLLKGFFDNPVRTFNKKQ